MGERGRERLLVRVLYSVHFLAVSVRENHLIGSIKQDSVVHCPEWILLILTNLIFATLTLLHLLKPKLLS